MVQLKVIWPKVLSEWSAFEKVEPSINITGKI